MSWKEFFKFTKGKIISLIIFIIVSGIAYIFTRTLGGEPPVLAQLIYLILIYLPLSLFLMTNYTSFISQATGGSSWGNFSTFIIGLILVLIYQYILICIFAWLIGKIKSKQL